MEKTIIPEKTNSFSSREEKHVEPDQFSAEIVSPFANDASSSINEKKEKEEKNEGEQKEEKEEEPNEADFGSNFHKISEEVDRFISNAKNNHDPDTNPLEIPDLVEKFAKMVEGEISKFDSSKEHGKWSQDFNEDSATLLQTIDKVSMLTDVLGNFASNPNCISSINRMSNLIQRAMLFLEEEFRSLLKECVGGATSCDSGAPHAHDLKMKQPSFKSSSAQESGRFNLPDPDSGKDVEADFPGYSLEIVSRMNMIAKVMISATYETECCQAFSITRRNLFEQSLAKVGFEKISVEDIHKMNWEPLEGEIATCTKACKLCITAYFEGEKNLCEAVFSNCPSISDNLFSNLARGVVVQFLNFAEALAMTKRSAERLFKVLDMYETLGDLIEFMDRLFPGESSPELKSETSSVRCRIGEVAVSMFSDLENSIKADSGKTSVPGGAVHPLTRYVMNYLKYACEYKDTLEQIFQEHQKRDKSDTIHESENEGDPIYSGGEEEKPPSPFSVQLMAVMDLLDSNLDAKAKLYKDLSLSYIFLMNNGRYILQKIKGSTDIHYLLGDKWRRKRSSDLRQYHKNYQRETWSKVLVCLRDEGLLQGKGTIVKPLLKERFKAFNAMIEEIHKTQSTWVVSDEQLQSELRVSISAVVIPAYRSFLGRFQQYLDPGRQTEKYIKFGPEELEASIDDLFDGTPASMVKRRS